MKKLACTCKQCGANASALLDNDHVLNNTIDNWVVHQEAATDVIKFKHLREMSASPPHSPVADIAQVFAVFLIIGLFLMILPNVMGVLGSLTPNQGGAPNIEHLQEKLTAMLPYVCGFGAFFCLLRGFHSVYSNLKYEQEYAYIMAQRELIANLKEKAKSWVACTYCKSLFSMKDNDTKTKELNPVNFRELFRDE